MKIFHSILFLSLLGLLVNPSFTNGQTAAKVPSVKITGEVTTPLVITLADLKQYPQTEVVRKDKDGKDHTYKGVMLANLLQKAGATMGKDLRGENLAKYVMVEASDGYQVVFALAELDKEFTDRTIILADETDGKPLPEGDGTFRIIVQDEKKPARCIKQVVAIKVMFTK